MPGRITSLLDPSRIMLDVRATKRTTALHDVAKLLEGNADVANFPAFYDELLARGGMYANLYRLQFSALVEET